MLYVKNYCQCLGQETLSLFSSRSFMVSGLIFKPLLHLGFSFVGGISYRSSFIIWVLISNYPRTIYWKNCFLFIEYSWLSCQIFSSVTQSCPTLWEPRDWSKPCSLSANSRACSNSCPLSWWYHPTISSSVIPFSSHLQSFPASGSFLMSQFFTSGGQIIGASASASVLPMNIQDWFPLGWTGLISL